MFLENFKISEEFGNKPLHRYSFLSGEFCLLYGTVPVRNRPPQPSRLFLPAGGPGGLQPLRFLHLPAPMLLSVGGGATS